MSATDFDYLWTRRHELLYRIELSALYHQKRERFFESCDKLAKAVAVIGGSAALARIGGNGVMPFLAAAITVTSTLSLVFGLSDRARRHFDLARSERSFDEGNLAGWVARQRLLETGEPPALEIQKCVLDEMAVSVEVLVIASLLLSVFARRDHDAHALPLGLLDDGVTVVAFVGQQVFGADPFNQ